jgi:hypothetical protein
VIAVIGKAKDLSRMNAVGSKIRKGTVIPHRKKRGFGINRKKFGLGGGVGRPNGTNVGCKP